MYTQEITVQNEVGLHARPATYFIQLIDFADSPLPIMISMA